MTYGSIDQSGQGSAAIRQLARVSTLRVGRTKAPEDGAFRVFQIRYTELSLWSALLAPCLFPTISPSV
jgi:hypothetical protein